MIWKFPHVCFLTCIVVFCFLPTLALGYCRPMYLLRHGTLSGDCLGTNIGDICNITCSGGYYLIGSGTRECGAEGKWTGKASSCIRHCRPLRLFRHGKLSGDCLGSNVGDICNITCLDNYQMIGNGTRTCDADGQWSGKQPSCVGKLCSTQQHPDGGKRTGQCDPGLPNKSCHFACKKGYILLGFSEISCRKNGTWSAERPQCVRKMCKPMKPPRNGFLMECLNYLGSKCYQVCKSQYVSVGPPYRTCLPSGRWNGSRRRCVKETTFRYILMAKEIGNSSFNHSCWKLKSRDLLRSFSK